MCKNLELKKPQEAINLDENHHFEQLKLNYITETKNLFSSCQIINELFVSSMHKISRISHH